VLASTLGRFVVRVRGLSKREVAPIPPKWTEVADRSEALKSAISGWATQVPVPSASWPGNTLGDTTRGP
jgi:hypothetical protein